MKRGIFAVLLLGILGFYVAWPAWSGYSIRLALQNRDPAGLAAKIDFDRVRLSLRPTVTRKVDEGVDRYQAQLGAAGEILIGRLRTSLVPKIVDASMNRLLTPETVIRIAAEGGTIKESLERIMREQIGRGLPAEGSSAEQPQASKGLGGLLGKVLKGGDTPAASQTQTIEPIPAAGQQQAQAVQEKRRYSISNVKSFAIAGPLSFRIGVAKDPAASESDVTAEMAFSNGDWKIVGLVPRI